MFVTMSNDILRSIKSLNIEWCKILEYPRTDKTGGWVSENFSAMERLGIWFYTNLENIPDAKKELANVRRDLGFSRIIMFIIENCYVFKDNNERSRPSGGNNKNVLN